MEGCGRRSGICKLDQSNKLENLLIKRQKRVLVKTGASNAVELYTNNTGYNNGLTKQMLKTEERNAEGTGGKDVGKRIPGSKA